ncbi:MAG: DNA translocase FtsK [Pseudomonadota bacterium]
MSLTRSTGEEFHPDHKLKNSLRRNIEGAGGLLVICGAALIAATLATWSVDDPSWSHATSGPVRNVLGGGGAVIADLAMQFIGLASILIPLPMVFWGWRIMSGMGFRFNRRRAAAWVGSIVLGSGFLACLPVSQSWPLPIGLGGVIGDWLMHIPLTIVGSASAQTMKMAGGLILGIGALACFLRTVGVSPRDLRFQFRRQSNPRPKAKRARKPAKAERSPAAEPFLPDDEISEEPFDPEPSAHDFDTEARSSLTSKVSMGLGALFHWVLSTRAQLRKANRTEKGSGFLTWMGRVKTRLLDPDDGLDDYYSGTRREPSVAEPVSDLDPIVTPFEADNVLRPMPGNLSPAGPSRSAPIPAPQTHADPVPIDPASNPVRVTAAAPPAKPGKRVIREAQGTLLEPEEFAFPPLHLLSEPKTTGRDAMMTDEALEQNARILEGVLEDFGVRGEIINVRPGPVVTLYELEPAPGIKSSRVIGLADDIARSMSAISARVAVIPGKNAIGIELPNPRRETVYLRESLASEQFEKSKAKLALCLGKTIGGEPVIADLARMPHLLVAGTTGSGKSVAINTMIASLLYRLKPDACKLIMVDPKMLELSVYDGIPHLLTPVVTDPKKAVVALKWTVREMEQRYKNMSKLGVRNIDGYNNRVRQAEAKGEIITRTIQTGFDRETGEAVYEEEVLDLAPMPYIVVIVDEMADLMIVAGKDIEGAIQRLAQMARAAGIHIIMATQRPSVDVITGTIKANFPTRISFQVTSKIDSRTILGEQGAEQLLGMGDMLYMAGGGRIQRVHGPFVTDDEVENIVNHLKTQGVPEYLDAITDEDGMEAADAAEGSAGGDGEAEAGDLYEQAVAIVLRDKKASTSYVQRRLSIGYNRAASIIERMEQEGLISAANHAGKREILVEDGEMV